MADNIDAANDLAEQSTDRSLAQHQNRHKPQSEYDNDGNKTCIDCEVVIPKLRAAIDGVCRCIECQAISENPIWAR